MTRILVRRHIDKIDKLGQRLLIHETIVAETEIRDVADLAAENNRDYWAEAGFAAADDVPTGSVFADAQARVDFIPENGGGVGVQLRKPSNPSPTAADQAKHGS